MRLRNITSDPQADHPSADPAAYPARELIAASPFTGIKRPFTPFSIDIETEAEAHNLAIALRNHQRYMGHGTEVPSLEQLAAKLGSFDGIDMNVYAE